jgi:hydrogenase maturation factor
VTQRDRVTVSHLDGDRGQLAAAACAADEHCITCGDVAVPMLVVRLEADTLVSCRDANDDAAAETVVDVELVGDVAPGDLVLVHAGTALVLLAGQEPA